MISENLKQKNTAVAVFLVLAKRVFSALQIR